MNESTNSSDKPLKEEGNKPMENFIASSTLNLEGEDRHLAYFPKDSKRLTGQGFYRLAKIFYDKADLNRSEEFFQKALKEFEFPQDSFIMFKIYGFLIRIYSEGMRESLANELIVKSENLLNQLEPELGSMNAECFYNTGVVANYKGDFEAALDNFTLAYQKSQKENEPELMAKSLFSLSKTCLSLKKYQQAQVNLEKLTELLAILKKEYLKGSMYYIWGNLKKETGDFEGALVCFKNAIKILQSKTSWNQLSYILLAQGSTYKKMGEYQKSQIFFDLAQVTVDEKSFRRLNQLIREEIEDLNDSNVDIYLDRHNRVIHEKTIGTIDFKHRFVLLEILFLLAKNPGEYYDKDKLASEIWKDEYNPLIHDKLIYTSVSRLRKLIEPKNNARKYILRGKDGYTFNPRVNIRFHRERENTSGSGIANVEINIPV